MTLEQRLIALATAIGADIKQDRISIGSLPALGTTAKDNLVAAINELKTAIDAIVASPGGVAIELYLALIAALLLQLYSWQAPNRRMMELIQLYLLGVASLDELEQGLERQRQRFAPWISASFDATFFKIELSQEEFHVRL